MPPNGGRRKPVPAPPPGKAAPAPRTREKEELFLSYLAKGWSVTGAAERADLGRRTVYQWADGPSAEATRFREEWAEAVKAGTEHLEDIAMGRARDGTLKGVYYEGEKVGEEPVQHDTLMIFLLKARDPTRFRESVDVTQSGEVRITVEGGLPAPHDSPEPAKE